MFSLACHRWDWLPRRPYSCACLLLVGSETKPGPHACPGLSLWLSVPSCVVKVLSRQCSFGGALPAVWQWWWCEVSSGCHLHRDKEKDNTWIYLLMPSLLHILGLVRRNRPFFFLNSVLVFKNSLSQLFLISWCPLVSTIPNKLKDKVRGTVKVVNGRSKSSGTLPSWTASSRGCGSRSAWLVVDTTPCRHVSQILEYTMRGWRSCLKLMMHKLHSQSKH